MSSTYTYLKNWEVGKGVEFCKKHGLRSELNSILGVNISQKFRSIKFCIICRPGWASNQPEPGNQQSFMEWQASDWIKERDRQERESAREGPATLAFFANGGYDLGDGQTCHKIRDSSGLDNR
jgi:hypothetical protein